MNSSNHDVCIVGAGPAGATLALLLARKGIKVALLDRETDFKPIERGALIQPSTLLLFRKLGVLDQIESKSQRIKGIEIYEGHKPFMRSYYKDVGAEVPYSLAVNYRVLQLILIQAAEKYPNFQLFSGTEVKELRYDSRHKISGIDTSQQDDERQFNCRVLVASDGGKSIIRNLAGINAQTWEFDHQFLTFVIKGSANWPKVLRMYRKKGHYLMITPNSDGNLRVMYAIEPGTFDSLKSRGLHSFFQNILTLAGDLEPYLKDLTDWKQVRVVSFRGLGAETWVKQGLVLLGDSAHSIHPFGAQGMNLSMQDAAVVAPLISDYLVSENSDESTLKLFEQKRRPVIESFAHKQANSSIIRLNSDELFKDDILLQGLTKENLVQEMALGKLDSLKEVYARI